MYANAAVLGVLSRVKVLQRDACGLEGVKEALRHRVSPTVALATQTGPHPMLRQQQPRAVGVILTATIGMHDAPRRRLALTNRHRQRPVHSLRPPMGRPRPADHGPRVQIQHYSKLPPAFARREGGHISTIDGIWSGHRKLPGEAVRGHRLSLPSGGWRLAPAGRFAAPACLGQQAPHATAADP